MKYHFTCKYCGHIWIQNYYYDPTYDKISCEKCKDKNVKITEIVDYYTVSKKKDKR